MNIENLIIIGAGASGLVSAITSARCGYKVTLLEQNSKAGKKILVSGNGKCNIGNKNITLNHFHSQNKDFIDKILKGYDYTEIEDFFNSIGLELTEGKDGKMFPLSLQASSVLELLLHEVQTLGVDIIYECEVTSISHSPNNFTLQTSQGQKISTSLIIASGSESAPQLGGSSSGYEFATKLGHTLIDRHPSLVQLCSQDHWVKDASGVKVAGMAKLYANGEYITQREGDLLFTNYGISGLAILDLSREVSIRLADFNYCELHLDLMPHISKEKLTNICLKLISKKNDKPLNVWLQGIINKKLISAIIEQSKCKITNANQLNRKEINRLIHSIKNLKLNIDNTRGFKSAEVSTGGINTKEINPLTLESNIVKNLYFTGEILDVDGDRGGFNFHFAWVCGLRVMRNL